MMPQTERDAQISRRFVSESLSSLDYKAFNETRTRFVVEKIHSSLLYNHLNRKKMSTLIATERSLCFSWHLHWKPSKDTTHGGAQRTGCSVNSSFFPSRTIADRCRQSLSSVWWRRLPKLWGGGRGGCLGNLSSEAWMNSGQALLTFSWLPKQTHPKDT